MKKQVLFKKLLCMMIMFCMSMTTYSAIVSDNDGSAFVTKAEFDALKNSFNEQISDYNESIDGKIDGAIAAYLSGIKLSSLETLSILVPGAETSGVYAFNQKNPLDYKVCYPIMSGQFLRSDINSTNTSGNPVAQPGGTRAGVYVMTFVAPTDTSKNKGNKTTIKNLYQNATEGKSVASWDGYHTDCIDYVIIRSISHQTCYGTGLVSTINDKYSFAVGKAYNRVDGNIIGMTVFDQMRYSINNGSSIGCDGSFNLYPNIYSVRHDWGKNNYPYICATSAYNYDMFSNYDRDYNWAYRGTYMTKFPVAWDGSGNPTAYAQNATCERPNTSSTQTPEYKPIGCNVHMAFNNCIAYTTAKGWYTDAGGQTAVNLTKHWSETASKNTTFDKYGFHNSTGTWQVNVPMIGFETKYLTNWNQIYLDDYDTIVNDDTVKGLTTNTIISDASNKHLSVCAGFPLAKISKETKLINFDIKFDDPSANYDVWFKFGPFGNGDPDSEACFEGFSGLTKDTTKNHAFKISGKGAVLTMLNYRAKEDGDAILFVKWAKINTSDRSKDGGGIFYPTNTYTLEKEDS